jgi:hypothetical protein
MIIGLAFLATILALYALGSWLSYRENTKHRPRYQGSYRAPCLDVANRQGRTGHSPRPLEFCN